MFYLHTFVSFVYCFFIVFLLFFLDTVEGLVFGRRMAGRMKVEMPRVIRNPTVPESVSLRGQSERGNRLAVKKESTAE